MHGDLTINTSRCTLGMAGPEDNKRLKINERKIKCFFFSNVYFYCNCGGVYLLGGGGGNSFFKTVS